jgi:hypothetical protein
MYKKVYRYLNNINYKAIGQSKKEDAIIYKFIQFFLN